MKITPKIVADAIRELNDTLQQDDPGCSCHRCAPCGRCTDQSDVHGNNLYEIPVAGARYFFSLGESFLYLTFIWDASVGLRYVETTNEEQSESELVHSLAAMPKGTRRRFEDAIYYELNKTPKTNGTTPDFIIADDIHDDRIDPMPGGIEWIKNDQHAVNDDIIGNILHDQRPPNPKHSRHSHALSLAVGRLGRTPDLHTELRKGVDPYSRD